MGRRPASVGQRGRREVKEQAVVEFFSLPCRIQDTDVPRACMQIESAVVCVPFRESAETVALVRALLARE